MRFTNEETLREVLKRSRAVRKQKERRIMQVLSGVSGLLVVLLVCVIASFTDGGTAGIANPAYGAFFLSAEAGGYVLVAVIAFAVGVVLTIAVYKYRRVGKSKK